MSTKIKNKGMKILNIEQLEQRILSGSIVKGLVYGIKEEAPIPSLNYKGRFGMDTDNYEDALEELKDAFPTSVYPDYAVLNPIRLPPVYAFWDDNEVPNDWKVGGVVTQIEVDNDGHDVSLTLLGNVLGADLKREDLYIKTRTYMSNWNNFWDNYVSYGLGVYTFDSYTSNVPSEFGTVEGESALVIFSGSEEVQGIAYVRGASGYNVYFVSSLDTTLEVKNKFINSDDIVDNLTTDDANKVASAKTVKQLEDGKQDKSPEDGKSYLLKDGDLEEYVEPEPIDISGKQDKSPEDGKSYLLKDGDLEEYVEPEHFSGIRIFDSIEAAEAEDLEDGTGAFIVSETIII